MKQSKIKKNGFSLIEVIFAVSFLSLIVFGVIRLQTSYLVLDNTQQNELKANFYVNQALEVLSALSSQELNACGQACYLKKAGQAYQLSAGPAEFLDNQLFERSITQSSEGLLGGAHLFTVTIKWTDSTGEHQASGKRVIFNFI